jgi:hypothetical protein
MYIYVFFRAQPQKAGEVHADGDAGLGDDAGAEDAPQTLLIHVPALVLHTNVDKCLVTTQRTKQPTYLSNATETYLPNATELATIRSSASIPTSLIRN